MKPEKLAIDGGKPVRTKPLPLEFPGVHHMDRKETQAALRVLGEAALDQRALDMIREIFVDFHYRIS